MASGAGSDGRLRRAPSGGVAVRCRMPVAADEVKLAFEVRIRTLSPAIELHGLSRIVGSACTAALGQTADMAGRDSLLPREIS